MYENVLKLPKRNPFMLCQVVIKYRHDSQKERTVQTKFRILFESTINLQELFFRKTLISNKLFIEHYTSILFIKVIRERNKILF